MIFNSNKCNGVFDCLDRSDETDCQQLFKESNPYLPVSCIVNRTNNFYNHSEPGNEGFQCGSNICLDTNYWCNKNTFSIRFSATIIENLKSECESLLDLIDNDIFCKNLTFWQNKTCNREMTRCRGNVPGQCVVDKFTKLEEVCNYNSHAPENTMMFMSFENAQVPDCIDRSDHFKCMGSDCDPKDWVLCKEGVMCIHEGLICDGHNNCPEGSDEDQSVCEKCPRETGHPYGRSKSATFSCLHRYTNKTICAVPCDGIDDLCKDQSDELCESDPLYKIVGVVFCFFMFIIFIGECSIELQELISKRKNSNYKTLLLSGQEKDNEIIDHVTHLQPLMEEIFKEKRSNATKNLVLSLLNTEMLFHGQTLLSVFVCIKNNMDTTKEGLYFSKIVEEINSTFLKAKENNSPSHKKFQMLVEIYSEFKAQYLNKICIFPLFLCRTMIAVFGFSFDLIKDISFAMLLCIKLAPLEWPSFEFTICFLLALSIVLPIVCNLLLVLGMPFSKHQSGIFAASMTLCFPFAPCIAIYICNRLDYSLKRIEEKGSKENIFAPCTKKLRFLSYRMKLNEYAIENPLQILILMLIFCIDYSKTSTVTGLQNLFVGGENVLTFLSLVWSFCSLTYGHVRWIGAKKNNCLPWNGMLYHGIFVVLTLTERTFAILIYFSPSLGLLNLLGHWTMGKMSYLKNEQFELNIDENGNITEIAKEWVQTDKYEDLTIWPVEAYFYSLILSFCFHFILTAIIKYHTAINFRSKNSKLEKILHLITQTTCPLSYTDWDESINSNTEVEKNWKKVNTEMKCMLGLFCIEHIIMTIPLWILSYNIYLRNQYLDEYFPQVMEEKRSTLFAYTLSILCPIVFVILMFLKYQIILLYHRCGHPWSIILKIMENPERYNRIECLARTTHSAFELENEEICEINRHPKIHLNIKEQEVKYTRIR